MATAEEDLREVGVGARYRPLGDSPGGQNTSTIQVSPEIEMERIPTAELIEPELSNKPKNRPYYQQSLKSWSPLLTPWRAVGGYLLIGLIFVPLGAVLWDDSDVVELK